MQFTMLASQKVSVLGSPVTAQVDPSGNAVASTATLSNVQYSSSDPAIFTVSPDPAVPNGAIVTGVAAGTATLTETATATEPDGVTTEQIQGVATIILTSLPVPVPVAAAIEFTFGSPA